MPRLPIEVSYYNPVIETMSRDELLGLQWKKLKQTLDRAYHTNPYYHSVFQKAKSTPDHVRTKGDFAAKVPIITKSDIVADGEQKPPYGLRLGVPEGKLVTFHFTPGPAGLAQDVYGLTSADSQRAASFPQALHWMGIRRGDVCVNTLPTSLGNLSAPDNFARGLVLKGTNLVNLGITYTTQQKLQLMERFSPHLVIAMGEYLMRLTAVCQEMGIEPRRSFPRLKSISCGAPPAAGIKGLEEFWDARIFDVYGSSQVRAVCGANCEKGIAVNGKRRIIHILQNILYFEVVDRETREPVAPGEEGELIITTLGVEASPVIRFATNDKVRYLPYSVCDCGRPFDGIESGSFARFDDMFKIKLLNLWPQAVDEVVFNHKEVVEYQARIWMSPKGEEKVTINVEFKGETTENRRHELMLLVASQLKAKTGLSMDVDEAKESLPRFEFLPIRWKDERAKGQTGQ